jgi:S1-C subfamily serine protease
MRHRRSKKSVGALQLELQLVPQLGLGLVLLGGAIGAAYWALRPTASSRPAPSVITADVRIGGCGSVDRIAVAFMVNDRTALTVAHSLRGARRVSVAGVDAEVVALDHRPDLAVLRLKAPGIQRPGIQRPGSNEPAMRAVFATPAIGTAELRRPPNRVTAVKVSTLAPINIEEPQDNTTYRRAGVTGLISDGVIRAGDSGSPVVNKHGEVVAMLFATDDARSQNVYAVAASEMIDLVRRAETGADEPVDLGSC